MIITDLWQRAGKTAVQAFFGVLIPEVICWLTNIATINWADWKTWCLPVVGAALAAGISAGWNALINKGGNNDGLPKD